MNTYRKVTSFHSAEEFAAYVKEQGYFIGLSNNLGKYAEPVSWNGYTAGNRWAALPMEGWDCEDDGNPSELTRRRWLRFATSGAKLLFGTEAGAVMESGRSNPQQLMIAPHTQEKLKTICAEMRQAHKDRFGSADDLQIGLQLTHSGRYSHPHIASKLEPRTAYAHPQLDIKYHCSAADVLTDTELYEIIPNYIQAAKCAQYAGFDFVDLKLAHGYLGHELLTAYDRKGDFGGSWENRTRFIRMILEGIHKEVPGLEIASRISIFDMMAFEKGPDGFGRPMAWDKDKVYPYAFSGDGTGLGMDPDLKDTVQLIRLLEDYGIKLICGTCGSPYYNVHLQRPAYFPVCDGYEPPEPPLYNVGRQIKAAARLKELCPEILLISSGMTCLQEYLPQTGAAMLERGQADFIGIGRMLLSYPDMCADVLEGRPLDHRRICRTFGDCTNAPRCGMVSGCYPLDEFYKKRPEAAELKACKVKKTDAEKATGMKS